MPSVALQILSLAVILLMNLAVAAPIADTAPACWQTRIFAARGTGQSAGVGSIGITANQMKLFARFATVEAVQYPASYTPTYLGSVKIGATNLQAMIKDAVDECPNVRIVLLGYSQGAQVVGDALVGSTEDEEGTPPLASKYADNIRAVVLMGDVSKDSRQTFILGTGGSNNGMIPRANRYDMAPFTDRIASYCDWNDPVCDGGDDWKVHWGYQDKYHINAAWFALSKLWHSD